MFKDKKCYYYGGSPTFRAANGGGGGGGRGEVTKKKTMHLTNCLKRGLRPFAGGLPKNREESFFERGVDTSMHF